MTEQKRVCHSMVSVNITAYSTDSNYGCFFLNSKKVFTSLLQASMVKCSHFYICLYVQ